MRRRTRSFLWAFLLLFPSDTRAEEPLLPLETLLSPHTRLMVFSPHPDDETLGAGGLIQRVLRSGGTVKVVFMTSGDGYPEGVELEDHISHPTAQDYRQYGTLRQDEAVRVLATLGLKAEEIIFFGFPDRGLCPILLRYRSDKPPYYTSPFTLTDRPPAADMLLPDTEYNSADLKSEIARVLATFRPTLLAVTHPADEHPDHCATYFFAREALQELRARDPTLHPHLLTFLIHFGQWPIGEGAGTGSRLFPPHGFPKNEATWMPFPLSPEEAATKRHALLQYHSQMLTMGRYLLSFARANELFAWDSKGREVEKEKGRCCQK